MSVTKIQPATDFIILLPADWVGDNNQKFRQVIPEGGTQFVFTARNGEDRTVLEADYANFIKHPVFVDAIKTTTDCTRVLCWV